MVKKTFKWYISLVCVPIFVVVCLACFYWLHNGLVAVIVGGFIVGFAWNFFIIDSIETKKKWENTLEWLILFNNEPYIWRDISDGFEDFELVQELHIALLKAMLLGEKKPHRADLKAFIESTKKDLEILKRDRELARDLEVDVES